VTLQASQAADVILILAFVALGAFMASFCTLAEADGAGHARRAVRFFLSISFWTWFAAVSLASDVHEVSLFTPFARYTASLVVAKKSARAKSALAGVIGTKIGRVSALFALVARCAL
jgi:hypothetical protein